MRLVPAVALVFLFPIAGQSSVRAADASTPWAKISVYFTPPAQFRDQLGDYRSPLLFDDGSPVKTLADWKQRRQQIRKEWEQIIGAWPPLLERPAVQVLKSEMRDDVMQQSVRIEIAPSQTLDGYLLLPNCKGPFPAVVIPFYEPETSIGRANKPLLAFGYELAKRGFVTLSIGSPGGDARKPLADTVQLQPLSYLGYVAANCRKALASLPQVRPDRIGIVGHSYGGKWALFAGCLDDGFAAVAVSDPGIVWDESRPNVNYWEPWYLGLDAKVTRKPGVITADAPRTGGYKSLVENHHDLTELESLLAPRPFLLSGGAEDPPVRWTALNHLIAVTQLLGKGQRVGMTTRPAHTPTAESNEVIYSFFEHFLKQE